MVKNNYEMQISYNRLPEIVGICIIIGYKRVRSPSRVFFQASMGGNFCRQEMILLHPGEKFYAFSRALRNVKNARKNVFFSFHS